MAKHIYKRFMLYKTIQILIKQLVSYLFELSFIILKIKFIYLMK